MKKRGLHKGLDSLLGDLKSFREKAEQDQNTTGNFSVNQPEGNLLVIPINQISQNPNQPRKYFSSTEINQLADSIQAEGIIQPLVVRKKNENYQIVAGERRFRAAQKLGLTSLPCVVKTISDESANLMSLIENLQREDLNEIEKANSYNQLIAKYSYTHEQLAEKLGQSRTQITNTIRLLKLGNEAKQALVEKKIEMGQARALLSLEPKQQTLLLNRILREGLSTREVEKAIATQKSTKAPKAKPSKDVDIMSLEQELSNKLATKVEIKHQNSGKGALVIHYSNLESMGEIINRIQKK